MKDTNFPTDPNLEARIVAWVLGEASPFEAAELERHLIEHPELAVFKRRIEAVHGLVDEAVRPVAPLPKLSDERRAKLLATFGAEPTAAASVMALKPYRARLWWQVSPAWMAAAACLMVGLVLLWLAIPRNGGIEQRQKSAGFYLSGQNRSIPVEMPRVKADDRDQVAASTSVRENVPFAQYAPPPPATEHHGFLLKNPDAGSDSVAQRAAERLRFAERESREVTSASARDDEMRRVALNQEALEAAKARRSEKLAMESPERDFAARADSLKSDRRVAMDATSQFLAPPTIAQGDVVGNDADGHPIIRLPAFAVVGERQSSYGAMAGSQVMAGSRLVPPMQSDLAMPKPALPDLADVGGKTKSFSYAGSATGSRVAAISAKTGSRAQWSAQRFDVPATPASTVAISNSPVTIGGNLPNNVTLSSTGGLIAQDQNSNTAINDFGSITLGPTNVNGSLDALAFGNQAAATKPVRPAPAATLLGPAPGGFATGSGGASPRDDVVALDQFSVTSAGKKEELAKDALEQQPAAQVAQDTVSNESIVSTNDLTARDATGTAAPAAPAAAPEPKSVDADKPIVHPEEPTDESLRTEVQTQTQSISTFSLHVSDVSFRLAQAALDKGELPDRGAIRPEEFYNAFDYGDPAPVSGEPVSCRLEQAADPFRQQRNLVRIAMKIPATGRGAGQPLRLTVLLDTSGSMEREDRVATVRQAFSVLASLVGADDQITLIGFARQPRLLAERVRGTDAKKLVDIVAHTPAEGGTNLEEALKLAGEQAREQFQAGAQNRIVVLTDGAANLGNDNPERLAAQVAALRQQGISFDACGIGIAGLDDSVLEALTRKGDGRYYVVNSPEEADAGFAHQLAGALRPAAENVKVQVRFNPARVQAYRLIGFEQHRLKTEDFRNDRVTAAELAADEGAIALYQVQVKPDGEGELGDVFVRFRNAATGEMVERSWTLTYEAQPAAFDRAAPSMQLAGVAALLAEKLRGGAPAGPIRLADLAPTVNRLRAVYSHDTRVQQLVTMYGQTRRLLNE